MQRPLVPGHVGRVVQHRGPLQVDLERAAALDVQQLHPPADAEVGTAGAAREADDGQVEPVLLVVDVVERGVVGRAAVKGGVDVPAARDKEALAPGQLPFDLLLGADADEHRLGSGRADEVDDIGKDLVGAAHPGVGVAGVPVTEPDRYGDGGHTGPSAAHRLSLVICSREAIYEI